MRPTKKNGGPAFPVRELNLYGLSVRDYFAGQALVAMFAGLHEDQDVVFENIGANAYRIADAMLAAREEEE